MPWETFDARSARPSAQRGFVLIGRMVRQRREAIGISQRRLEQLCSVDQTVISRLENGRLGGLKWSRFARLVDALGGLGHGQATVAAARWPTPPAGWPEQPWGSGGGR